MEKTLVLSGYIRLMEKETAILLYRVHTENHNFAFLLGVKVAREKAFNNDPGNPRLYLPARNWKPQRRYVKTTALLDNGLYMGCHVLGWPLETPEQY